MTEADTEVLGIVVVNFGSHLLLARHLVQLHVSELVRIVVVDNFSSDDERHRLHEMAEEHGWTVVEAPNLGFGAGVNRGVRSARALGCSHFLLLNPDAQVSGIVVEELRRAVVADPLSLVTPVIVRPDGTRYFAGATWDPADGHLRAAADGVALAEAPNAWLTAACLAVGGEIWARTGGFDEDYFLYWEDVDLSRRALLEGGRLEVRSDLSAVHDEGGTQRAAPSRAKSATYYFYNCRNRLLFAQRLCDPRTLRRWVRSTPRESWEVLLRGGRRQLVQDPRLPLAALRGSLSGLRMVLRSADPGLGRAAGARTGTPSGAGHLHDPSRGG